MFFLIAVGFSVGIVVAYGLFAYPAGKTIGNLTEDLKLSKSLLEEAQKDRSLLKQQAADQQYKLNELEKDLAFERSKKSS